MKTRLLSLMLAALLLVSLFPLSASAADIVDSGTCGDNLTWTLDSDGLLTISGTGAMTDYDYGSLTNNPFYQNTLIKRVVIEPGVSSVGAYAFRECSNLTSATIAGSVTSIKMQAFLLCSSLMSVTIPDSVTSIGELAFDSCSNLMSVMIPESVTDIGERAFSGCSSLTSIAIPDGMTSIGNSVFGGCSSLISIIIPDSVTSIGNSAFTNCSSLTSIAIPDSVTSIGDFAFSYCSDLTSVELPASASTFGMGVFRKCTSLTNVAIPSGVTTIEAYTFEQCRNLVSVSIPASVTLIRNTAFYECVSLTDVLYGGSEDAWKMAAEYNANFALFYNTNIHYNVADPATHFRSIVVPATCEADGYTARTCDCGYEYDRVVTEAALGHDWTPWATLLEPTATTKGVAVRVCAHDSKHVEFKALPTVPDCPSKNFTDVDFNAYYHIPMDWAVENGVTTGVTDTTFAPNRSCSRAQFVTFLWRAKGCPEPTAENPFADVPDGKYYTKAVLWALEQGITTGVDETHFAPDRTVTRAQTVTFLWRAEGKPKAGSSVSFPDVPASASYAEAVAWAAEKGITTGTNGRFNPQNDCTRAQIVTFLYRAQA